jgi:alpha-tubulin suppressor-like RCC1 family protein
VTDDGKIWCWGNNQRGELGDGTTEDRGRPVPVRGLPGRAIEASAGYAHTCALMEDGTVYCWGDNTGGQIDPQTTADPTLQPTLIATSAKFVTIVAGQGHTCGTTADGKVYCWGNTLAGQCGADPSAFAVGPTEIPGLDQVTKVQTVKNHLCAVRASEPSMVCWGSNQYLEKGGYIVHKLGPAADALNYSATPVPVDLGKRVVDVGMGFESTYATTEDGMTYSWGYNGRGQLGLETMDEIVPTPSQVLVGPNEPLSGAKELIRSDGSDLCAEMSDTNLGAKYVCWGGDDYGELGFGVQKMSSQYVRATAVVPNSATNLVRGEDHGCFIDTDESGVDVWCYGNGHYVGNGTTAQAQVTPARVAWDAAAFEAFAFGKTSK